MTSTAVQTILIVDDDPDVTRALNRRLTAPRHGCIAASSGVERLSEFRGDAVDLIVRALAVVPQWGDA